MTKLDELRKLAEASKEGITKSLIPGPIVFVEADTILAMCDLLEQMRDSIKHCKEYAGKPEYVYQVTKDALAAFDKWNNEQKG